MQSTNLSNEQALSQRFLNQRLLNQNGNDTTVIYQQVQFVFTEDKFTFDAAKNVWVIAGQGLCFHKLVAIISLLNFDSFVVKVSINQYHQRFGESVINICVDEAPFVSAEKLAAVSKIHGVDILTKSLITTLKQPGLLLLDMDSTIIEMECIDEIAALAGVGEQVSEVTERAMRGEIAFSDSLHHRVSCLKGVEISSLKSIRARLPYMPGFEALVKELKQHEWRVAIASGGFTYFADFIKHTFELDSATSNVLEEEGGKLTGKVLGKVIDGDEKANVLLHLANKWHIPSTQTVAMGDGANDLVMMKAAQIGVAFRAKDTVQQQADINILSTGLTSLLYILI